jgi:hypothetical protein
MFNKSFKNSFCQYKGLSCMYKKGLLTLLLAVLALSTSLVLAQQPDAPLDDPAEPGTATEQEAASRLTQTARNLIRRGTDALAKFYEIDVYTADLEQETQEIILVERDGVIFERSYIQDTTSAYTVLRNSSNMQATFDITITATVGNEETSPRISGEMRYVDGILYIKTNGTNDLPKEWVAVTDQADYPLLAPVVRDALLTFHPDVRADELAMYRNLAQVAVDVRVEESDIDEIPLDVIIVTLDQQGVRMMAEYGHPIALELMPFLEQLPADQALMQVMFALDPYDNLRGLFTAMVMDIEGQSPSEIIANIPEDASYTFRKQALKGITVIDFYNVIDPISAPESLVDAENG